MKLSQRISISFGSNLQEARFIERPNRFIIRCQLQENANKSGGTAQGEVVEAHLPDPGRLKELLFPENKVWLRPAASPRRKTAWSAVLCEVPGGNNLVSLDSTLPNRLIARALRASAMQEFAGWSLVRPEFQMGSSRWDFLLTGAGGQRLVLEVKSVTLVKDGVGLFPDAVTRRGAKHVRKLAEIARCQDWQTAILFVVQREDVQLIRAAEKIDPDFAAALLEARTAGVKVFGRKCQLTIQEAVLAERVAVE
ncbi:MAG: DNA/RNA nuclease SfsA [Clostridia bacterium]|nr:DNA/RNA nuclease SfsA [Clostridia bacterium]